MRFDLRRVLAEYAPGRKAHGSLAIAMRACHDYIAPGNPPLRKDFAMTQLSPADPVVILSYARTPMGAMQGALSDASATDLGAVAVKAAVERAGVSGDQIDRAYMGCVLPAGLGQAPARQAAIKAGLPLSVEATTVNKVCGSGMQTVIMGAEALASGTIDVVVAGGMESMTNAPYLLKKHRSGARLGHDTAYDMLRAPPR
jgi:acetyl-CoA C-acetyltransferase